ncbi:ubiquinone biosynthesis O-methyltransferase [Neoconidiobolus thromboides FSU 785]|nr:ubiquinone biosynthesis O-methyltransferase [Neoconidiobolus thromboides FSU 785]
MMKGNFLSKLIKTGPKINLSKLASARWTRTTSSKTNSNITINAEEVEKFGAMSAEWWSPYGNFKLLHQMNLPRVEYILNNLKTINNLEDQVSIRDKLPLKGLKILDVGCGGGLLSESLARLGAKVTGVDASEKNIAIANLHKLKDPLLNDTPDRLTYYSKTNQLLEEKGEGYFDHVCSFEVIEHVNSPQDFMNSLSQLVKKDGKIFLSTINRNALSHFLTIFMAEYFLKLTPIGTHDYNKYVTPNELAGFIRQSGLELNNVTSIHYNPLKNAWLTGNSIFPAQPNSDLMDLINTQFPVNYLAIATKN